MSLFSALTVAVGGLNAQSSAMGNISDNISNAQTTGFKRIDTEFQSLVTQSNSSINDPGGVRATPYYQNGLQGNLIQSQNSTSVAISGNGFYNVSKPIVAANGDVSFTGEDLYTRRGDFRLDKDGYMINGAGYVLKGWNVDTAGTVDTSGTTSIKISDLTDSPVATSKVTYAANLPASSDAASSFTASTVQLYDSLGAKHGLDLQWQKGQESQTNTWYLKVTPNDALNSSNASIGTKYLKFVFNNTTNAGTIDTITEVTGFPAADTSGAIATADASPSPATFTVTADAAPDHYADVSFNAKYAGAGTQSIKINFGKYDLSTGVTQYDATDLSVATFEQNGIPRGSFRDLTIDKSGFVILNYDNGRSRTLYQIPVVTFNSPNNLQRVDGAAFSKTTDSGTPSTNAPGNLGSGKIVSNTLEGANVDIADEFTKMIQAQRVYSANARTITTTNSMLEEVINVVR